MIELPHSIKLAVSVKKKRCRQFRNRLAFLQLLACSLIFALWYIDPLATKNELILWIFWPPFIGASLWLAAMIYANYREYSLNSKILSAFNQIYTRISTLETVSSSTNITTLVADIESQKASNPLVQDLWIYAQPQLKRQLLNVHRKSVLKEIELHFLRLRVSCFKRAQKLYDQHPLVRAGNTIGNAIPRLKQQRANLQAQWDSHYANLSWWNKLNASTPPVLEKIQRDILKLEQLERNLSHHHANNLKALENLRSERQRRSATRLARAKSDMEKWASHCQPGQHPPPSLANKALFFSVMSIPVSAWGDLDNTANVYDVLRGVNENYANSSDLEIWLNALFMPAESLAGLTSLTKGAYLEHLVAEDTGGELHEHFNTPDTDIVIDGQVFQIKATDSESYINSVDPDVTVIATSEIANATGAIDSGYSNEELTAQIGMSLGGTVVDLSDTAVDAVLSGVGGLGLFATFRGIAHADKQYQLDGDAEKAIIEGAEVAVVGTAKAMVDTAELGYKVASRVTTSAPSRFLGRSLLKGVKALDRKLSDA